MINTLNSQESESKTMCHPCYNWRDDAKKSYDLAVKTKRERGDKHWPDPINPQHYTSHPSGVECIQITKHMNFCLGNAMKYIWRAGQKGDAIEDLNKAAWYIQCEIDRLRSIQQDKQEKSLKEQSS